MFGYCLERRGSFEIGRPRSKGWNNFGRSCTRGVGSLLRQDLLRSLKKLSLLLLYGDL